MSQKRHLEGADVRVGDQLSASLPGELRHDHRQDHVQVRPVEVVGGDVTGAAHDVDPGHDLVGADRVARDPRLEDPVDDAEDVAGGRDLADQGLVQVLAFQRVLLVAAGAARGRLALEVENLLLQERVTLGRQEIGQLDDALLVQAPADRRELLPVVGQAAIWLGDKGLGRHAREPSECGRAAKKGLYTGLPRWAPDFSGAGRRPQSGSTARWRSAILGTIVAARGFSLVDFGIFATVLVAAGFFQSLLDLTVEDSLTKYGFRYVVAEDWGRLRRLFRRALELKLAGGVLAAVALLMLAPLADRIFGSDGLALPLADRRRPPVRAGAGERGHHRAPALRGRYDLRALAQAFTMGLRLVAIAVGVQFGVVETIAGIVLAQAIGTAAVTGRRDRGVSTVPAWLPPPPWPTIGADIVSFVLQSSVATGLVSLRNALAPLLLGIAAGPTQVGLFRIAQAPQTGFNAASGPVRLILLTEHTRDWERGRSEQGPGGHPSLHADRLRDRDRRRSVLLLADARPDRARLRGPLPAGNRRRADHPDRRGDPADLVGWAKSFPVSIGRPRLRLVTTGIETALLLPLVLVLGLHWGATGAAIALLASSLVYALCWAYLYPRIRREQQALPRPIEALAGE